MLSTYFHFLQSAAKRTANSYPISVRKFPIQCILFIFLSGIYLSASGSHIMGGTMNYSFVSETTDTQFYKIKLVLYKETHATTLFEDSVLLGIHKNDSLRSKVMTVNAFVVNKKVVSGVIPGNNCGVLNNFQIEQIEYEVVVGLPYLADTGYIVTWARCCRITGEVNLSDNYGMLFTVFISPGKFKNSSPDFKINPFMFLCPGKVSEIIYQVGDKDGDSLVYSFVQPYIGGSAANPLPYRNGPDVPDYLPAFNKVTYNTGYSATKPFGAGGMAQMDPLTPKSYMRSQQAGLYSLAVEVKEYRQGVYLSAVRYDFIIYIPLTTCNNLTPNINTTSGDSVSLVFWAGKNKCYQMIVTDTKDSVFLTSKGDILDGTGGYNGTPATLPDTSGFMSVPSQLCWTPPLSSVRSKPYLVEAMVLDNGCPAAMRYIKYFITVIDLGVTSTKPQELSGNGMPVLFPNPVSKNVTIKFAKVQNPETRIQIFNLHGQMVFEWEGNPNEKEFELDISELSAGVYLLLCERDNERIYSKLVKKGI